MVCILGRTARQASFCERRYAREQASLCERSYAHNQTVWCKLRKSRRARAFPVPEVNAVLERQHSVAGTVAQRLCLVCSFPGLAPLLICDETRRLLTWHC